MKNIQEEIKKFCEKYNLETSKEIRMLDLTSEIGELSKEIIKSTDYGSKTFKKTENLEIEMGDVLFSLITLANQMDIDLEKALEKALEKYKKRFETNKNISSF